MLPIIWNPVKEKWCVYDTTGKELWSTEKYADAVMFADDYLKQQQASSQNLSKGL